jgi:hypothetical protein
MPAPTYFATKTIKISTGLPALQDKESLRLGVHLDPCHIMVPLGSQLGNEALDLLKPDDIADMIIRGQISETPPEIIEPVEAENPVIA